jgi:hypothetical protein
VSNLGRARVPARCEDVPSRKGVFIFRGYDRSSASVTTDRGDAIPPGPPARSAETANAKRQTPIRPYAHTPVRLLTSVSASLLDYVRKRRVFQGDALDVRDGLFGEIG